MGGPKITLYVDVISPFAYLAYYVLRHHPIFRPVTITYKPILLGGLMKSCDNRAPIEIRNKDKWIHVERLRWAHQFHVPMSKKGPDNFPFPTLHVQRFLTALHVTYPDKLTLALDTLYASLWTEPSESKIADPKVFGPILEKALGKDVVSECIAKMGDADVKKQLVASTEQAFADGAFGLPWFHCENASGQVEGFWGFDHLGQVVRFLELDDGGKGEIRALL
ncbi:putative 2-hydroxychromene-2-carboxylate isomerase [Exophiala viscosa]|uniref:Glutathione S-transferase kappa n=1 Tax=Exophiala viscosa TaxID=2486360 RepID=A0AAN6DXJ4_9EURO|nr:putative 2-hydroxychromene-2-carboxylate isomerase [Exophiala viscosa]KAI1621415.1 putative 2-hydroxychromene-2-carboxylate isomerase [Exophiala viscosa]